MGSIIVNYYRKKDLEDKFIPKVGRTLLPPSRRVLTSSMTAGYWRACPARSDRRFAVQSVWFGFARSNLSYPLQQYGSSAPLPTEAVRYRLPHRPVSLVSITLHAETPADLTYSLSQKYDQRRIQVFHSRDQDQLRHRSNVSSRRSSWTALEKSHRARQATTSIYHLQTRREESRSNQGSETHQVLPRSVGSTNASTTQGPFCVSFFFGKMLI